MSEPCPECNGTGVVLVDSMLAVGVPGGYVPDFCDACHGGRRQPGESASEREG